VTPNMADDTPVQEAVEDAERVKPHVPLWNGVGKYTPCFVLEHGSLTIYGGGCGMKDGDGYLAVAEDELDWDRDDDGKSFITVRLTNSDLIFLRDNLNKLFPQPRTGDEVEPTQRADNLAAEMRAYYEAHKHVRWQEGNADNLMLGLLNIALTKARNHRAADAQGRVG
jgi:hypothetical protein